MNLQSAINNWKNFARQMVGMPKLYPVKVKRTEAAKQFPLIKVSKQGDVGYNLASTADIVIPAATNEAKRKYSQWMLAAGEMWNKDDRESHERKALEFLPKAMIPTGIHLEMPDPIWCSIEARSSSSSKMLITPDAIIDTGYTGELYVVIYNFGYTDHQVNVGDMLAQIIFHERIDIKAIETDVLKNTDRGATGFGSTGANIKEAK